MVKLIFAGFVILLTSATAASAQTWVYKEVTDKFTDKTHIIATNDGAAIDGSGRFKVSFECRDQSEFVFTVNAYRDLGGKNTTFKFRYRADSDRAKKIRMQTFTNSSTGGMNKMNAVNIVNDFLNADRVIVRAISSDNDEYNAEISLNGAAAPILKAVSACGLGVRR